MSLNSWYNFFAVFCPSRYLNYGRRVFTHPSDLPLGGRGEPVDTVVTFSCYSEYYLSGPSSVTCQTSGSWSPGGTSKCNRSNEIDRLSCFPNTFSFCL